MTASSVWGYAALILRDRRIEVDYHQHLSRQESRLYDADAHGRAIENYREALLGLRQAIDEQLGLLPEPEKAPEKSVGHISPSAHG